MFNKLLSKKYLNFLATSFLFFSLSAKSQGPNETLKGEALVADLDLAAIGAMEKEEVLEKIKESMGSVNCDEWWYHWARMIKKAGGLYEIQDKGFFMYVNNEARCQEIQKGFVDFLRTLGTTDLQLVYLINASKKYPTCEERASATDRNADYIGSRLRAVMSKVYQALVLLNIIEGFTYAMPPAGTDMKNKWHLVHLSALGLPVVVQNSLESHFVGSNSKFPLVTVSRLLKMTPADLACLPDVGELNVSTTLSILERHGLKLAD